MKTKKFVFSINILFLSNKKNLFRYRFNSFWKLYPQIHQALFSLEASKNSFLSNILHSLETDGHLIGVSFLIIFCWILLRVYILFEFPCSFISCSFLLFSISSHYLGVFIGKILFCLVNLRTVLYTCNFLQQSFFFFFFDSKGVFNEKVSTDCDNV